MSITDPSFIAALVALVLVWWLTPSSARPWAAAALCASFLLWANVESALLLSLLTLSTWLVGVHRAPHGPGLALGIAAAVGVLFAAKSGDGVLGYGIPLGLSYYALRCVHFMVERYKGTLAPPKPQAFLSYLFFLPTLTAGPIHRFGPFERDLRRLAWSGPRFSRGLERILGGYAKVIILGNFLISVQLKGAQQGLLPLHPRLFELVDCLRYGLNLYAQFSGYSDVAVGVALLLGFKVMENFDHPWRASNLSDFWQRWHISLSQWCRDYIYLPVVAATRSGSLGIIASMVVLGLWHELSWRYLAWGVYHGGGIVLWRLTARLSAGLPRPPAALARPLRLAGTALTLLFVTLGFALTKGSTLEDGLRTWGILTGLVDGGG